MVSDENNNNGDDNDDNNNNDAYHDSSNNYWIWMMTIQNKHKYMHDNSNKKIMTKII